MKFNENDAELFKEVAFLVEATNQEYMGFWADFSHQSDHPRFKDKTVKWEQESLGKSREIGKINGRPIVVDIRYARLNGRRVAFLEGCSQLVDHVMIREWLEHFTEKTIRHDGRWAHCDSSNFHHCLDGIGAFK